MNSRACRSHPRCLSGFRPQRGVLSHSARPMRQDGPARPNTLQIGCPRGHERAPERPRPDRPRTGRQPPAPQHYAQHTTYRRGICSHRAQLRQQSALNSTSGPPRSRHEAVTIRHERGMPRRIGHAICLYTHAFRSPASAQPCAQPSPARRAHAGVCSMELSS